MRKIILRKHKQVSIAFLNYFLKTVPLGFGSTGENNSLSEEELWDVFMTQGPGRDISPLGFNSEIEQLENERNLVVKNNNALKQKVTELELKLLDATGNKF